MRQINRSVPRNWYICPPFTALYMIDQNFYNRKSPKYYVREYLETLGSSLQGKIVIDMPAGNGVTSELLLKHGAKADPFIF
jgi:hypothetical protein